MKMRDSEQIKIPTGGRLRVLTIGNFLLCLFLILIPVFLNMFIFAFDKEGATAFVLLACYVVLEVLIFFTGIIMIYFTSVQVSFKLKLIGLLVGWIPIAHLVALFFILRKSIAEQFFEKKKIKTDRKRAAEQICATKYPIVMVHGIFFRDFRFMNYWGRIPAELERNGAKIFYGNHESAETVEKSAEKIRERILEVCEKTGCDKVNVIAHSKGGLDTKYAIANTDIGEHIASLTTINTPHGGCEFAEYLLDKIDEPIQKKVAGAYNATLKRLGDKSPDFIMAVRDLTATRCKTISQMCDTFDYEAAGIFTQSVGSCMKKAKSGAFPLNMSYKFVDKFDGPNDGLVGEPAFHWGSKYTYLENKYNRGISHGDMIDLNRENITGFDVREFYVNLVADLKNRGL